MSPARTLFLSFNPGKQQRSSLWLFLLPCPGHHLLWLQVTHLLGRPLGRTAAGTSGLQLSGDTLDRVDAGCRLLITPVPVPRSSRGDLTFAACRLGE